MSSSSPWPIKRETGNTWTHFGGAVFALSSIWMVWFAVRISWQMTFSVIFFLAGMFLMFLCSTIYHWVYKEKIKRAFRKCDHISIYVMIACSYTPILVGVVGGWIGWLLFGVQWALVIGGAFYKIFAIDRWPRLSLAIYLVMGWSVLFVSKPVFSLLSSLTLWLLLAEGLFYTAGTYFFAHDNRPHYHAIWHIFVLLGAIAHWGAVLTLVL